MPVASVTSPSTESSTRELRGSLVRIVAVWRNGPGFTSADHSSFTITDSPGGMGSFDTLPIVHLQVVLPTRSVSGLWPALRTENSCDLVVPRCIAPNSYSGSATSTRGAAPAGAADSPELAVGPAATPPPGRVSTYATAAPIVAPATAAAKINPRIRIVSSF